MTAEVLVAGGGLAGSAAAIVLARGGRDVVLVEREAAAQHKVCGEFLSAEALGYLAGLGVDVAAMGAVPIRNVRLDGLASKLPFAAMSLTRRRLDEELLGVAAEVGVRVVRGCSVEGLECCGEAAGLSTVPSASSGSGRDDKFLAGQTEGWEAMLSGVRGGIEGSSLGGNPCPKIRRWGTHSEVADDVRVYSGAVFVATGKHDLRGFARPVGRQGDLVAFKMYWKLKAAQVKALDGHVELILYRGGYAGLQPVEDGTANLCCLIERKELQRLGGRWDKLLEAMLAQSEHLRERLEGAEAVLERPLAVSAIPYGFVREQTDGIWWLGDQAAVIPSFTGDGMSIALHTGMLAARMYLEGKTAEGFQRRVHRELTRQVGLATWVSRGLVARPGVMKAVVWAWPGVLETVAERTRISPAARVAENASKRVR